jgi:hypothetical protein
VSAAALASAVLTILSVLLGTKYRAGKAKAKQLAKLLATVVRLLKTTKLPKMSSTALLKRLKHC